MIDKKDQAGREMAAIVLFSEPNTNTETLADLCGFSHGQSFCRAFRRWYGMTVSQYRREVLRLERRQYAPRMLR
jgi:AraC-like DNA-binding protein